MGRRRRGGVPVHGWLVVDKPAGLTSAAVVARLRRATGAAKAGHAGTLDPAATGVLPLAFGEATKTVGHVMDSRKAYGFTVRWGEARDTDDAEGLVTATSAVRPDAAAIRAALPGFVGTVRQVPPRFSAIKLDGRRAYAVARAQRHAEERDGGPEGEDGPECRASEPAVPAAREVRIEALELVDCPDADHARFTMICGKGTYVRSVARDLAQRLGTCGHVAALRRTASGPFDEAHAIPLERLEQSAHDGQIERHLIPLETALDDIPALAIEGDAATRLRQGQPIRMPGFGAAEGDSPQPAGPHRGRWEEGAVILALCDGRPVALARWVDGALHPTRVLNL